MSKINPNLKNALQGKELKNLTSQEIDDLSPDDLDLLKRNIKLVLLKQPQLEKNHAHPF